MYTVCKEGKMDNQRKIEEKKLSVIVPVYNTAQYLEKCIGSILSNTYQNIEIICINDGSTDESETILNKLANEDSRIKVVHTQNGGVSKARNLGLSIAQGELISFVDSDDWIEPDYYSSLLAEYSADRQLWICDYYIDYENKQVKREIYVESGEFSQQQALSMLYSQDYFKGFLWNKIFLNSLIKQKNLTFDESIGYCEDLLFVTKYMGSCEKVYYNINPFCHLRIRSGSATQSANYRNTLSGVKAYQNIVSFLEQNSAQEEIIETAESRMASLAVKVISDMAVSRTFVSGDASEARKVILKNKRQYILNYGTKYRLVVFLVKINPKLLYLFFCKKS